MSEFKRDKATIFVFVYKPKDENKKEKGLGIYMASSDGKEIWSYSGTTSGVKDIVMYLDGFLKGMRKALELGYEVVEICGSNRNIINNFAIKKGRASQLMGKRWVEFNELRDRFFSCQIRFIIESKNKVAKRSAKIGIGEKIIWRWV